MHVTIWIPVVMAFVCAVLGYALWRARREVRAVWHMYQELSDWTLAAMSALSGEPAQPPRQIIN